VGRSSRGLLLAFETEGGAFRLNTYRDSDKIDPTVLYGMKGMAYLKFTDEARRLIAFSPKGMLLVWDTDLDQKRQRIQAMSMSERIHAACALAARPLTQPELLQYVGSDEGGSPCGKR
jgi:hypothetical protein